MNEQDHARCFTPENVAKKWPRTSSTLQTPHKSTKSTPLWEKVLNMTNMQLKFITFVGAYLYRVQPPLFRCRFIHLFYSLARLKFVTVMSRVINKHPTKSVGLSSSEHCEYVQTLFRSRHLSSLIDKRRTEEKAVWPRKTTVTQRYSVWVISYAFHSTIPFHHSIPLNPETPEGHP